MKSERIDFEGLANCRDLGGFVGLNHKKTVYKKVFRSDSLDHLTENDVKILSEKLHVRYDIDLRAPLENAIFPDTKIPGAEYLSLPTQGRDFIVNNENHKPYDFGDVNLNRNVNFLFHWDKNGSSLEAMKRNYRARIIDEEAKRSYAKFFSLLANLDEGSVLFHCHDGKDRTGVVTMLYLGILGVSDEDILEDYLATNIYVKKKIEARKKYFDEVIHLSRSDPMYESLLLLTGVHKSWLLEAMDEVNKHGGYEEYLLHEAKVNKETIERVRNKYLQ